MAIWPWVGAIIALSTGVIATASAGTIDGTVFVDRDQNGVFSASDDPVVGAVVFWESTAAVQTDAAGGYTLSVSGPGIVWVSVPNGYRPGPVWQLEDTGADATVDLALVPVDPNADARAFTVASDSHAGLEMVSEDDIASAFAQLVDLIPPPAFFAITGDLTQNNQPEQFDVVEGAVAAIDVPFVPIPGNHDWYDGGAAYRRVFGPPSYSFEAGGIHYMVINDAVSVATRAAFVSLDLSFVTDERPVVVFTHAPPPDELISALGLEGVDFLFTGHLHSNRVLVHDLILEFNTQPLAMGGIDTTPGGFRVVRFGSDDQPTVIHRTTVEGPYVALVYPRPNDRVTPCAMEVIAAVEVGAGTPTVTARAGYETVELARTGAGWTYTGRLTSLCDDGVHQILLEVETDRGEIIQRAATVYVTDPGRPMLSVGEWPQLQGGPSHHGVAEHEHTPPLRTLWAAVVDGNLHGGSPVVAAGAVFVPIADFGDGSKGGVVSLDARSGAERWRYRAGAGVRSAVAATPELVILAGVDGLLHAVEHDTGAVRWTYQIAETAEPMSRSVYASPTIVGDVVFAGNQREFVALELATGDLRWTVTPGTKGFFGSHVTPAVADDLVVASFAMGSLGLHAWDSETGTLVWRAEAVTAGMMASPIIDDSSVYIVDWQTQLTALDRLTGAQRWTRKLDDSGFEWGYGTTATPALTESMLLVPTHHGGLFAIDRASGVELWRIPAGTSRIRTSHYRGATAEAYAASPIVAGSLVWIGGTDGVLRAIDPETGTVAWAVSLGAPITMGAASAGDLLVIGTYDGTVRALVSADLGGIAAEPGPHAGVGVDVPEVPGEPPDGCGCRGDRSKGAGGLALLGVLIGAGVGRRRRGSQGRGQPETPTTPTR